MSSKPTYEELEQRVRELESDALELKVVEAALRKSEEKFRNIYSRVQVGIFRTGLSDGKVLECNDRFAKTYGFDSREECMSDYIVEKHYVDPETREQMLAQLMEFGEVNDFEARFYRKDGQIVWVRFSARSFPEEGFLEGFGFDITREKEAEETLQESEEKHRRLFDTMSQGVIYQNSDGAIISANPSAERLLGLTFDQMKGKTSIDPNWKMIREDGSGVPGTDHPAIIALRSGNKVGPVTRGVFHPVKNAHIWLSITAIPLFHPGESSPFQAYATFVDITERKRTEEALRESEEKYRRIYENSVVGFFESTPEGRFLHVNIALAKMLRYESPEDLVSSVHDIASRTYVNPADRKRYHTAFKANGYVEDFQFKARCKDGSEVWLSDSSRAYFDGDGEVIRYEGIVVDITERKRAEEALRESQERYRILVEESPLGVSLIGKDRHYRYLNPKFVEIFGYTLEDVPTGKEWFRKAYPDEEYGKEVLATWIDDQKRYGIGEARPRTYQVTCKDGSRKVIHFRPVTMESGDQLVIYEDVTETHRLEERLRRAQKMEAMGLLAGGVAHDLNNILSGIVSYPELILMDLPEGSPLRKPMKTIHESGMRAAGVVSDLLTIARGVATGKDALNLNTIVSEYMGSAEFRHLARTNTLVNFRSELDSHLLNMHGSPIHLKKTLMNIVTNASEAIEGGGTVTISTFNRYLDEPLKGYDDVRTGEYVVLSVSDNGRGISSKDLERIFEPFYTKKVMGRSGTGLGLAVVWNTVQDHNGYINVVTGEHGTTFILYFPVTRDKIAEEKEPVGLEEYMGHGEKILVVDDEESQREIAIGILTKLGYHAEAVSSGEEAIEYVRTNPVDLIVLDMVMPKGMNGRETYQEIIKVRPRQKAIIASGYAKTDEVDAAQKLGAGKCVKKPYTLEKIGIAVKGELGK